MNRKQRNDYWKRWGFVIKGRTKYDDVRAISYTEIGDDSSRVNANRKAAKQRAVYHTKADWECPEARTGICFRCKWQKRCKAIHP